LLLCLALAGCETDQQRTKTQGTVFGAAIGSALGAGLGAATGALTGNSQNIVSGAIIGGITGATLGGVAGYQWGTRVAYKKEQYKNSEDRLRLNISRASEVGATAARENDILRRQIASLNEQLRQLSAKSAAGYNDRQARNALAISVEQRHHDVE